MAGDGDEAFPVHRAMMASSSDYFKAMFTGESLSSMSLFTATSNTDVLFVCVCGVCVELTHASIALFLLPSCSVITTNKFYIHEHLGALAQGICSLVAVIWPPGKLLNLTLWPHPSSIVCHCYAFMFMALCHFRECASFFLFLKSN